MTYRKTYLGLVLLSLPLFFLPSTHFSVFDIVRFESDPLLIAVFNVLGILPALYLTERLSQSKPFKLKEKWSYGLAFGLGAFALLWGLNDQLTLSRLKGYRILHAFLVVSLVGTLVYGFAFGHVENYVAVWQTDLFVRVMTLDFTFLLSLWIKRWLDFWSHSNKTT